MFTKRRLITGIVVLVAIVITSCFICSQVYPSISHQVVLGLSFEDKTPEEIFRQFVLTDNKSIPPTVTQIEGLEGAGLDPLKGPVYIHFQATSTFITQMLEKDYQSYNPYTTIPCDDFLEAVRKPYFIRDYPEKFEWWKPSEIGSPVCYRSGSKRAFYEDEAKYLLVDIDNGEAYFFRTITPLIAPD